MTDARQDLRTDEREAVEREELLDEVLDVVDRSGAHGERPQQHAGDEQHEVHHDEEHERDLQHRPRVDATHDPLHAPGSHTPPRRDCGLLRLRCLRGLRRRGRAGAVVGATTVGATTVAAATVAAVGAATTRRDHDRPRRARSAPARRAPPAGSSRPSARRSTASADRASRSPRPRPPGSAAARRRRRRRSSPPRVSPSRPQSWSASARGRASTPSHATSSRRSAPSARSGDLRSTLPPPPRRPRAAGRRPQSRRCRDRASHVARVAGEAPRPLTWGGCQARRLARGAVYETRSSRNASVAGSWAWSSLTG